MCECCNDYWLGMKRAQFEFQSSSLIPIQYTYLEKSINPPLPLLAMEDKMDSIDLVDNQPRD